MTVSFWMPIIGTPDEIAAEASRAEAAGWDGVTLGSGHFKPDCFVSLALAARETTTLLLSTMVAVPAVRLPVSLASSAGALQMASKGRFVLGLGRGDSAHAYLGMGPAPLQFFENYVKRTQRYLRREEVPPDLQADSHGGQIPPVSGLGLSDTPSGTRLDWIPPELAKSPLIIAGSGPKVIKLAVQQADGVLLAIGADEDRVVWAIELIRSARAALGLPLEGFRIGLFCPIASNDDRDRARELLSGVTASLARFSSMHGSPRIPVPESDRAVYAAIHDTYTMRGHFVRGSSQSAALTRDFVDRFAVVGPADECVERLRRLNALGIDMFVMLSPVKGVDPSEAVDIVRRIEERVIPNVR